MRVLVHLSYLIGILRLTNSGAIKTSSLLETLELRFALAVDKISYRTYRIYRTMGAPCRPWLD